MLERLVTVFNKIFVWSMWTEWSKPFKLSKAFGNRFYWIFCDQCEQNEQNHFKSIREQFLNKFLCDQCEKSEQNPFKYQKLLGTVSN